jgi:hypothetical protein
MCVPTPDARRTTAAAATATLCCAARSSFALRPIGRARRVCGLLPARPLPTHRDAVCVLLLPRVACRLCVPTGLLVSSVGSRLVAARAGARSTRRIVLQWSSALPTVSCTSSSLSARQPSARARSARVRGPKQNGGTSASARSSCAAAFEHRRESRTSVPAFGGRVRVFVGGTTSAGGAWCAVDVCRDRPAGLTLERASRSSTLKVPPNF